MSQSPAPITFDEFFTPAPPSARTLDELIDGQTFLQVDFVSGGDSEDPQWGRESVATREKANVVTSAVPDFPDVHRVLLDLDVPAHLVPSSTPGHSHLYADVTCSWENLVEFLRAATQIGLLEPGYVSAAEARGYTSLRLPGVAK